MSAGWFDAWNARKLGDWRLPSKQDAMQSVREKSTKIVDDANARLEAHRSSIANSLEAEVETRFRQEVLPELVPTLRIYGQYTTLSVFGLGSVGLLGTDALSKPIMEVAGIRPGSASDHYLRMFAQPVLEPFLEGMHEPLRKVLPILAGGLFAYGASCFGLGFLLGRNRRDE
eukprot:TRINITY_DN77434_c0_g1_i1.p1 TRINITY_DN77434_c0_g1~~TRINITY_DN77434_c0_g1_i1.p1  ORF type:complete len:191 (+),score=19.35 TRINITY_DN77434_c0_g1_i1:60-575(+)